MNIKNKKATQIVYSNDFLVHDEGINSPPQLFNNMTFAAITSGFQKPTSLKEVGFSRRKFYTLSSTIPSERYYFSNKQISKYSKNYLKKYLKDTILVGFEFQKKTKDLLNELDITFINFWIHPFKLLDDLAFSAESNNQDIYDQLLRYRIPKEKFNLYGNYWQERISYMKAFKKMDKKLKENSLLLIGQTELDKSLEKDGYILSLNDFQDKINNYKKEYNKIYYCPHPNVLDRRGKISKKYNNLAKFIKNNHDIEIVNYSTYNLLASDKVKKVVAISSSVIYEAQFFNKETEYLYQPLFEVDKNLPNFVLYDSSSGVSIENQQAFNPKFWADILQSVCNVNKKAPEISFDNPQNKCRWLMPELNDLWWGYKDLDNEKIIMMERQISIKKFKKFKKNFLILSLALLMLLAFYT